MDPNKRNVTAIRLRGEKSEGLILPIDTLSKYTDINKLKDGDQITVLGFVKSIFQEEIKEVILTLIKRKRSIKKIFPIHFLKNIKILRSLHII